MRVALALWPSLLVVAALLLLGAEGRGLASGRQAAKVLSAEGAQGYNLPTRDADGYTLYYNLKVTDAQIEAARKALSVPSNVLDSDFTFWHWTTWQTCIRRSIKGVDQGEIDYLINHDDGMRVGGGLYIARNPESSSAYGPCPLEINLKQGTPKYDAAILAAAGIKIGMDRQKAGLGTIIKFVHYYDTGENWWVTHSAGNIKSVEVGFKDWPSIPWWDKAASTPYAIRPRALTFIELWNLIEGTGGIRESIAKDLGMGEGSQGFNSLSWLKSFYILMQYIDGPSLVRAIRAFQNPWDAFEPQNFGGYMKAWTSFLDARIAKPDGSPIDAAGFHYGIASKGNFGEGTASAWAKRQRDESVLKLCKLVSGGRGDCTYRWDVVRAGGDEAGRTFKATPGQVAAMYRNPYLVVNAARQDDGNYLVYYYYPDPTHLNPSLQPRVSFNLWYVMTHTNYTESPELLKVHGSQLISELMLEMFTRHYGRPVDQGSPFQTGPGGDLNGLTLILDMVSIHPFTDFNGRTTRFYLTAAQIESAYLDNWWKFGDTPAAFISDFDLVTDFTTYQKQVVQATAAVNKLRIEMLAEWVRGLKTGMPKHFDLPAWGRFVDDALGWARGKTHVEFDESDFPLIEKRRFVDLLDKKLGTNWPSRNS